jgi:predicted HTH domain antitoxin
MTTLNLTLPEETVEAAGRSPEDFVRELRFAAAVDLYHRVLISQEKAAEIAGMDRTDFLLEMARRKIDVFVVDFDDLAREIARG